MFPTADKPGQTPARPANQKRRITLLRAGFLALLPTLLMAAPIWSGQMWFPALQLLGTALIIAAVLGRFWCILYIGGHKNQTVMQQGPYSLCRHPLYFFSTIGVIGFAVLLGSALLTLILGALTALILRITARHEEAYLHAALGPAYATYAQRTPAMLPNPRLFHTEAEITVRLHQLRMNFRDALVFLAFLPLAALIRFLQENNIVPTFPIW